MKWFTTVLVLTVIGLVVGMIATQSLAADDLANNLTAELLGAILTVAVVRGITGREQQVRHAGILSELLFLPLLEIRSLIKGAARFLTADLPDGVEADERWGTVADEMHAEREEAGSHYPG